VQQTANSAETISMRQNRPCTLFFLLSCHTLLSYFLVILSCHTLLSYSLVILSPETSESKVYDTVYDKVYDKVRV
jgi:hypothetical protein